MTTVASVDWPVKVDPVFGCWLWQGRTNEHGYPIVSGRFAPARAHRVVYEAEVGPIPHDRFPDHTCRRRACVWAPCHLELVTQSENEHRKLWRYRASIQRCPKGHELAGNAMITPEGGRICRVCVTEALLHRPGVLPRG